MKASQESQIIAALKKGPLTPLQALREIGTLRLAARISDLRMKGWPIETTMVEVLGNKRVARYTLQQKRPRRALVAPLGKGLTSDY